MQWRFDMVSTARQIFFFTYTCFTYIIFMWALPASAQEPVAESARSYDRIFFDRYYPQTALDMLRRLPGFTLFEGAALRGFGGSAGNVLIDGARPSTKTLSLEEVLTRIPAESVERIEVIRGAPRAGETVGQSIIANIIRNPSISSGTWFLEIERAPDGSVSPRGAASLVRKFGAWNTSTKVNALWERLPLEGTRISYDENGDLTLSQQEQISSILEEAFISTEAKRALAYGTLTLNGRFGYSALLPDTERLGFLGRLPNNAPDQRLTIDFDSIYSEAELGADWVRVFDNDWSLKLLALATFRDTRQDTVSVTETPPGNVVSRSVFAAESQPFEAIARTTLGNIGESRLKPEFGLEAAYNRLASVITLTTDSGTGPMPILLPAADVTVEELRGEIFANFIYSLRHNFTLEAGAAVEISDISVTGDAVNEQTFFFMKPSAAINYVPYDGLQLRLAARHMVGQLSFSDFAASAEAEDDRFLGGNPDLEPDQTTRLSFAIDLRSETHGAFNLEAFHEWRQDVLEQVVLPSGASGIANAGDARVWGITGSAALPLDLLVPGGLLEAEFELADSAFRDPITNDIRNVTGLTTSRGEISFRQDLVKQRFAWGVYYILSSDKANFFTNEASFKTDKELWGAFIETTRFLGVKCRLAFRHIGGQRFLRNRLFYAPDRGGEFVGSEFIDQERGMFIAIAISGQF